MAFQPLISVVQVYLPIIPLKGTPILGHAASVGAKYFAEDLGTDLMYMGEHDIFEVF